MEREPVLRLLDEREAARQAEVDRLQVEAERIGGLLAACRVALERVATALCMPKTSSGLVKAALPLDDPFHGPGLPGPLLLAAWAA